MSTNAQQTQRVARLIATLKLIMIVGGIAAYVYWDSGFAWSVDHGQALSRFLSTMIFSIPWVLVVCWFANRTVCLFGSGLRRTTQ
ncbi:hypothetical protein IC617_08515 [Neiella sp. HB171785]|uniref:Uncharacterized protein n=1 Tax=Neiella litorisoli TaxID=2771431 RepID=A0A8J6QIQ5_9GAMM|nr:hypothetical protein [Neiella litorisoli]MBD1389468.1 hypothetical protein [Neiella litorisoli]